MPYLTPLTLLPLLLTLPILYRLALRLKQHLTPPRLSHIHPAPHPSTLLSPPTPPHNSLFLGLDHFTLIIRAALSHTFLAFISDLFYIPQRSSTSSNKHPNNEVLTIRQPPILLNLFSGAMFLTADPENIKTVLATRFDDYAVGPAREEMVPFLGHGIFLSDGVEWRGERGRVRGWFGGRAGVSARNKRRGGGGGGGETGHGMGLEALDLYDLEGRGEGAVQRLLGGLWKSGLGEGETVDLSPAVFRMLLEISGPMVLGCEAVVESGEGVVKDDASKADIYRKRRTWHRLGGWGYGHKNGVPRGQEISLAEFGDCFDRICLWFASGGDIRIAGVGMPNEEYRRDCELVHAFVRYYAEEAITRRDGKKSGMANGRADGDERQSATGKHLGVLVDHLAAADPPLPVDVLASEALHIMFAARDTTAGTLCDFFWLLSRNPRVMERLRGEILEHFPVDGSPEDITFTAVKQLPYLSATIKETLRLHPVLPMNGKVAIRDTVLPRGGGDDGQAPVLVREGTGVAWLTWKVHRLKEVYGEDVESLRPERWLDGEGHGEEGWLEDAHQEGEEETGEKGVTGGEKGLKTGIRPGWAYVPFNGGPRTCIGQQFALGTMSYVAIRMFQEMEKEGLRMVSRDDKPWIEKFALTAKNLNGCQVAFEKRC